MFGQGWTKAERKKLYELRAAGVEWADIAKELGRTIYSVQAKVKTETHREKMKKKMDGMRTSLSSAELAVEPMELSMQHKASVRGSEHRIIVNGEMSVTLRIPEVMTVQELRGLLLKANRLFNLSGQKDALIGQVGAAVSSERFTGRVRQYLKVPDDVRDFIKKKYTGDNLDELVTLVNDKFGLSMDKLRVKQAAYRAGYKAK